MPAVSSLLKKIQGVLPSETHVVGGAVRDRLLDRPTLDIDLIVPSGSKKWSEEVGKKFNGKSFVLDAERGVYRLSFFDEAAHVFCQIDLADWQGKTLKEDLHRRDFSINALAIPLKDWTTHQWKKKVIDDHQGLRDLNRKIMRAVSLGTFKDDPLRLLRAYRIAAQIGFRIEKDTAVLIKNQAKLIKKPSPERVRDELLQLFSVPFCYPTIIEMDKTGLLDVIMPEMAVMRKTAVPYYGKGGVLKHTFESLWHLEDVMANLKSWFPKPHKKISSYLQKEISGFPMAAHLKWAVLLHDVGKPATAKIMDGRLRFFEHEHVGADLVAKMGNRFRWSNDETQRHAQLVRHHMRPGNLACHPEATDKAFFRFFRDLEDNAVGMLLVSLGDHLSYLTPKQLKNRNSAHELITMKMIDQYYFHAEKIVPPKIITGHEVMKALNLKPSPLIGELLREVTEAQVEGKISSPSQAISFLKNYMARRPVEKPQ